MTLLRPLPAEPFDTALTLTPRVDRYAQVMVRCNQYSVPARFIGHRLRVKLSASAVTVFDRTTVVARHQRAAGKGVQVLDAGPLPGDPAAQARRAARRHRTGPGPRGRGVHRRRMTRSGPRPARHSATARGPGRWSRCCCCTVTSSTPTCSPASAPRCRSARSTPTWSRSRPARPRSSAAPRRHRSRRRHAGRAGGEPDRAAPRGAARR